MLDLTKYNLDEDDTVFITNIWDWCINGQNEIILEYDGNSFMLEPSGQTVSVIVSGGKITGEYQNFDDLLQNHIIDGKPLIELIPEIEFGE